MAKATINSLKKQDDLNKKVDDLADIMVQGFDDVRTELKGEIQTVRIELKDKISQLRNEMRSEFSSVRAEIRAIKNGLDQINERLDFVYEKAMQGTDILTVDIDKLRKQVKKLQKQVAYLEAKTK